MCFILFLDYVLSLGFYNVLCVVCYIVSVVFWFSCIVFRSDANFVILLSLHTLLMVLVVCVAFSIVVFENKIVCDVYSQLCH